MSIYKGDVESLDQLKELHEQGFTEIDGNVYMPEQGITSEDLQYLPEKITGDLGLNHNKITSLKGLPKEIGGGLHLAYNQISDLQGLTQKIGNHLDLGDNQITSKDLQHIPQKINGILELSDNQITDASPLAHTHIQYQEQVHWLNNGF